MHQWHLGDITDDGTPWKILIDLEFHSAAKGRFGSRSKSPFGYNLNGVSTAGVRTAVKLFTKSGLG
jgi:hypothetical protein